MKIKLYGLFLLTIFVINCTPAEQVGGVTDSNTSIRNNISENTNPSNEQENSQASKPESKDKGIIGTWKHISSAKTPDGERTPLTQAAISWTFNEDGTGVYKQEVKVVKGGDGARKFNWELNGKDIVLLPGRVTYTIVEQNPNQMVWKNNRVGDYYIVEKQ